MAQAARVLPITYADYLDACARSPVKLEFHGGEIFAMTGGSIVHAHLAGNAYAALRRALAGKPCRPFNSELRIVIPLLGDACYPDASVVCGPLQTDPRDPNGVVNPAVLVEVLSPTTEMYDRGGKFELYRRLPSLRDYLLVNQDRNLVEHFARNDDGSWTFRACGDGETLRLTGADVELSVAEVYADVQALRELAVAS